ncbi:hypothetical protein KSF73_06135 [Burkholderiaceae bacterium DAT-1]|nr:hypothetical protein [Burkholderiaceae bacterium DAT-1]
MDIHKKIAAVLSIVRGGIGLLAFMAISLFFGGVAALAQDSQVTGVFAILGGIAAFIIVPFGLLDVVAGVLYLRGQELARIWLIISNVFGLLSFPIGTFLSVYSLWALFKRDEAQPSAPVGASRETVTIDQPPV